ncbi:hypothetical protein [Microbacterium sp. CIAB417]|uniref:hypothetical protein n=1 Tax=Microbacterium sp. CIAB417 TaxID=2860287 RepID=UPI001FAB67C1|nr:hypothetical protein [Microbacterium sp. CIAB417]
MEWIWILLVVVVVIVLFAVLGKSMRPKVPTPPTTAAPSSGPSTGPDAATTAEIDRLIAEGQTIRAIKVLRDATPGMSLQEAKDRVERWTAPATTAIPIATSAGSDLPADVVSEVDALLASGRTIEAVKLLRERTGWGLKESKDRVDSWTPGQG